MPDQNWADAARATRTALDYLGYGITPRCLPDEAEACGGTFAQHVVAHLATIKAVADHQLAHLNLPPGMVDEIYRYNLAELEQADKVDL